jgi:hypothetical protein
MAIAPAGLCRLSGRLFALFRRHALSPLLTALGPAKLA